MRTFILAICFLSVFSSGAAQGNTITGNSFLYANCLQIKESANFGLVFRGPGINWGMTWCLGNEKRLITYGYELGAGILFSREIPALGFYLKPVDLAYLFRFRIAGNDLFAGPELKLEYNYNLYPDLQSGFDYWFTSLAPGIISFYDLNYGGSSFRIKISSSLAGLTSRQQSYRDPYFYDLGVKYAIKHLNQDFTIGSFNRFSSAGLEILWKPKPDSRLIFGYILKYSGYYKSPEITILNHGIKLVFNAKQKTGC